MITIEKRCSKCQFAEQPCAECRTRMMIHARDILSTATGIGLAIHRIREETGLGWRSIGSLIGRSHMTVRRLYFRWRNAS